jgi:hypothetical protein
MTLKRQGGAYRALILGAGPAGTGPLVCALQQGRLGQLLDSPIAIVERGPHMGRGTIGQYSINSDTLGGTFLECLQGHGAGLLAGITDADVTRRIMEGRGGAVPLAAVGEFMGLLGDALQGEIDRHPLSKFLPHTEARQVRRSASGGFETDLMEHQPGRAAAPITIRSEAVVFAMGGSQSRARALGAELAPGVTLLPYDERVMLTNEVLSTAGVAQIQARLAGRAAPRVLIIGGSHSALSSAWTMLNSVPGIEFGEGDITILHRERFRIFYPSREAALAEGYTDFTDEDFCPVTKRLYRLAGFRLDSRDLVMRVLGMQPGRDERRVRLIRLTPSQDDPRAIEALLDQADLIIPAFGYRPNTVPILDPGGRVLDLLGEQEGAPPLVDTECRLLDGRGDPIPGMYGIGLASGFKLTGRLGGEPSFTGQTNGLWLYQNGVGELILNELIEAVPEPSGAA